MKEDLKYMKTLLMKMKTGAKKKTKNFDLKKTVMMEKGSLLARKRNTRKIWKVKC